jgi:hypothetical protein
MPSCLKAVATSPRKRIFPLFDRRSAAMQMPPAQIALRPKSASITGASREGFQSQPFLDATHCLILVRTIPVSIAVTNISTHPKSPAASSAPLGSDGANERQTLRSVAYLRHVYPKTGRSRELGQASRTLLGVPTARLSAVDPG